MSIAPRADHAGTVEGDEQAGRPRWVRLLEKMTLVLLAPSVAACVLMVLQIIVDVAGRSFFGHPLKGTLDMTSDWWMVATVFLALAYAQMRNEHIRATMVTELMPDVWQRCAEIASVVLVGLLGLGMAYYGWTAALDSYAIRESSNNLRSIPLWPFRFLVPLGCLGLTLQCLASIHDIATGSGRESHAGELV